MLFNSTVFLGFFAGVYALYLLLARHHRAQNGLLLVASYVFYGWWDWRFLGLIALSTAVDYTVGLALERSASPVRRLRLVQLSIATNLGLLGVFKYFDFFADSLADLAAGLGLALHPVTLDVVLPVGISFYTFQTMSYSIDVYRGRIPAARSPLDFALFVAFFPQLVAGPIERARRLLPQISRPRRITADRVHDALFLLSWGYFKKVVVGDGAGRLADHIFGHYAVYDSLDLTLGVLAFSVQIYADFSGYSDIARGLARLLGFDLVVNFRLPFFARSPRDFWRRWHVSLSQWLRDYLYIPLGGNRSGRWRTLRNLTLTMLLGGLWHGAAWHFAIWGGYHAVLLAAYRLWPRLERGGVPLMLLLSTAGWLIFRAESMEQLLYFACGVGVTPSPVSGRFAWDLAFFSLPLLAVELWQHRRGDLLAPARAPLPAQMALHAALLVGIAVFGSREPVEFLYFQF
jgi:D-alanyl-lipoteichoic acid acyltransferase DltB (MBOAT superfamily)